MKPRLKTRAHSLMPPFKLVDKANSTFTNESWLKSLATDEIYF